MNMMPNRVRNLLINWLLRLLDIPDAQEVEEKVIQAWLADSWQNPGARKYLAMRVGAIKDAMSGGEGLDPMPREKYVIHTGQHFEVLRLAQRFKGAYNKWEKEQQQKIDKSN